MKHHEVKHPPGSKTFQGDFPCKKGSWWHPLSKFSSWKITDPMGGQGCQEAKICGQEKKHPTTESCNFHLDPQSVWHLSSKGNCHDRLFIILAIVKSAVNWKKNSLLGCPATPTSSISREINCHGFCTVSLAYSFLVICMSDKENNELPPVFVWCFWYQRCKFHSWSKIQCPTSWLSR